MAALYLQKVNVSVTIMYIIIQNTHKRKIYYIYKNVGLIYNIFSILNHYFSLIN